MMDWVRRRLFFVTGVPIFLGVVVLAVTLVRRVLSISPEDKNAVPALAAGITVTGVLTTAAVTLVGLFLRQAIDLRTAKLAVEANARAAIEQGRLQMQTVMEAVRLLSNAEGSPASPDQCGAALVALARLGEISMALDLAAQIFPRDGVTTRAASTLCSAALESNDGSAISKAASMLADNWPKFDEPPTHASWPASFRVWPSNMEPDSRRQLKAALEKWLEKRPFVGGEDFRQTLYDSYY